MEAGHNNNIMGNARDLKQCRSSTRHYRTPLVFTTFFPPIHPAAENAPPPLEWSISSDWIINHNNSTSDDVLLAIQHKPRVFPAQRPRRRRRDTWRPREHQYGSFTRRNYWSRDAAGDRCARFGISADGPRSAGSQRSAEC